MSTEAPNITQLQQHLMDTLAALRDRKDPMDVDRARAVAQVATVLVDTAKVEVEFLKVTGNVAATKFLTAAEGSAAPETPGVTYTATGTVQRLPNGTTKHTLRG